MNKSFGYYCIQFTLMSFLTLATVAVLSFAAYAIVPDLAALVLEGGGSSGLGVASAMIPAILLAGKFYRFETRRMTRGEGWSMAFVFTFLAFVVSGVFVFAGLQFAPLAPDDVAVLRDIWQNESTLISIIFAVVFLLYILLMRLALWSGIRGEIKKSARLAAKQARNG